MIDLSQRQDLALKTDLYEFTMAAGYFQNNVNLRAVFELSCHTMPDNRSYLVACGLQEAVDFILNLQFSEEDINFLESQSIFKKVKPEFFDYLRNFKFSGDVWAIPEGEIFFAKAPLLQIEAPIIEAQILETYLLSIMNIECLVAAKATRVVRAARSDGRERGIIDFGTRRAHGPEAGVLAARAAYIGGCVGTSNVYAGRKYHIPILGTMAHSWVEAFDKEEEAFRKYQEVFPENTILLVDTYGTLEGVRKAIKLKAAIKGVRLDSGDLNGLSQKVRKLLDEAGLNKVMIVASGNLNEYKISDLVKAKAPIDLFGVGTDMVISRDWPALDLTYKLVQTQDSGGNIKFKAKRSLGKKTIPGRKQVFRLLDEQGRYAKDVVGLFSERPPKNSRPLLKPIIKKGELIEPLPSAQRIREDVHKNLSCLPSSYLDINTTLQFKIGFTEKILSLRVV